MPLVVGTHSGGFHADDVLAVAMLREFVDAEATIVRSRELDRLARCDVVVDVGGEFDTARRRFDHHQTDYEGPRSSAGMVLDWLEQETAVDTALAATLRAELVDYVDDVDNGRRTPDRGVPCFASMVGSLTHDADDGDDFDGRFADAVAFAQRYVRGIAAGLRARQHARNAVLACMQRAADAGRHTIELTEYVPWKETYFAAGGREHPTEFVLLPAEDAWRIIAIPPEPGSFANKRSLPAEWAGLTDAALEQVTGIPGARFCHKNRFIAVFATRDGAVRALVEAFGPAWAPAGGA